MNLEKLYQLRRQAVDKKNGANGIDLLTQTHWFTSKANFDPKTGEALPQVLSKFLAKITKTATDGKCHDRLWRITEHARSSVERLLRALNESPRREQALLPIHAVRELDANSFIKLSNRPGRNIREKLAGKPYLQAVRRFQSVNLPENRLLKAFITRLAELLELRRDCLGEEEDDLLPKTQSWLRSDEAKTIANWDNLPPNNTLLSHRDYRRVWDAWRWLQTLDDDIARDFSQLESREETMQKWNEYGRMYYDGTHRFAEMPVLFNYEKFEISPWVSQLAFQKTMQKIARRIDTNEFSELACVDFSALRPRYATTRASSTSLHESYLWQQWKNADESIEIELFNSDAAYLHLDTTSISSTDLFFSNDNTYEYLDRAAHAFASRLYDIFQKHTLIWLVPDFLNDFEIEITRRNINARFPDAMPLPRSVAAVFEQVDYSKINRDGFSVVVVDHIGGKTCATKLIAQFDADLKQRLPDTGGFYWERCPPVIVSERHAQKDRFYNMVTVDSNGKWHNSKAPERPQFMDASHLKADPRIGNFAFYITLSHSPVAGGMRLHALQSQAGDIPLWRDQIPELSIKVFKNGRYQRFYLVSRGTTVKPICGLSIPIPVDEDFELKAGTTVYKLPLFQGENADELGFSARLDSPAFPLKENARCKLNLTFEYGADEPYKLVFAPIDNSFPPVRATWRQTVEDIADNAPAPEYPIPIPWENLRNVPDKKGGGTISLIQEIVSTADNLDRWLHRGDDEAWAKLKKNITGWCRFLLFSVWRDGRSISDPGCPPECTNAANDLIAMFHHIVTLPVAEEHGISKFDLMVLFCAMHKDMPEDYAQWMTEQVQSGKILDPRAVGFALGDVSKEWQQHIFSSLASKPNTSEISVFAYAIWREQHFIERFSILELKAILRSLSQRLDKINSVKPNGVEMKGKQNLRNWVRATAESLELLLGLLRTRASANPEIKMLLQTHQKITKELAKQVERVTDIVAQSNIPLFSRVQINLPKKPEADRTPDLLYALRLYLTGDDGANAIHITSISDSNND